MDPALRAKLDAAHGARTEGEYDRARALYEELIPQAGEAAAAEAHWGLGLVLQFTGLFDECLVELQAAHEAQPESAKYYLDLAKTRLMLGDYDQAREDLNEIVRRFPDGPEAQEARKQLSYF
jgi:tetratricopeptide (TPR) repeat protein